ncbi:hypothetical protein [Kitasatospora sp. NPDC093558]
MAAALLYTTTFSDAHIALTAAVTGVIVLAGEGFAVLASLVVNVITI